MRVTVKKFYIPNFHQILTGNPCWNRSHVHNLFVTTGSDNESLTSLRYFPLFEDYLQARLERDYPGHTAIILLRKLGKYKQSADWHSAYRLCQQIDDISLTIEIIEQAGPALLANGMVDTLSQWLGELPADLLSTRPMLLSLKGAIALIGNDICNGLDLLNQAAARQDSGDRRGLAYTLVYRSRAHYFLGEYVSALKDAEDSLALVGEEADLGEVKAQALRGRGMSLLRLNRTEESIQDLENSLAIFRALGDESSSSHLHQELGSAYSVTGDLERAMSNYRKALEYWRSFADNYQMADLLDSLGVLYHHKGEYESSFLAFDEGLRHARQVGYTYREALILASLGDLLADLGADQIASEIFEEARCIAKRIKNRDLCFRLDHTLASLARRTGNLEESRRLWENAAKVALPDSMLELSHLALENARLNLAENRISEAIPLLNIALAHFHSKKLATLEFQTYILLAAAFQAMDEEEVSRLHIKTAMDGDISDRLFQAGFSASREIIPVLERATQDMQTGIEAHRFLERLHRLNDRLPEIRRSLRRHARTIKLWHPRIAFRAFGEMHITFEGKELNMDDRKSKRQRDFLFYLLQHKKGTSKERLDLVFGRNMDENGSWLRNALYRIRQSLASDIIIYQDGLYYFNPLLDYEYDVENFQYYLAKAKLNSDHPNSLILRQLVDIYRGDYAIGAEGNWVVPERERLDQGYRWAVSNLVVCYMDQGDGMESMNVCLNAIELNPLCEEYYRLAMRVSAKMGNTGNVYRYYQLCCRALEKLEIAGPFDKPERVRPSDQTYQLYKQLMK